MINNRLYVGGIPFSSTKEDLGELFSQAGNVLSAVIILDKENNRRSKGFGFVEMETEEMAKKAIEMFNGKDFMGRNLSVNIAKPREENEGRRTFTQTRSRR